MDVFSLSVSKLSLVLLVGASITVALSTLPPPNPGNIDECASNPCQNGATCIDLINSYSCKCTSNYTAPRCNLAKVNAGKLLLIPGPSRISLEWPRSPVNVRVQKLRVHLGPSVSLQSPFTIQWSLNGVPLPQSTTAEHVIQANSPSVSGVYRCNMTARTLDGQRWSRIFETDFYVYSTNIELKCAQHLNVTFSSPLLKPDIKYCTGASTAQVNIGRYTDFTIDCTVNVKNYNGTIRILDPHNNIFKTSRKTVRNIQANSSGVWKCEAFGGGLPIANGEYNINVTDVDECASYPCQNGGSCNNLAGGFSCNCTSNYTGPTCNFAINPCNLSPCQNGATCNPSFARYTCSCPLGFQGTNCAENTTQCSASLCQNGGACRQLAHSYLCSCAPGYTGRHCLIEINECASNPCQNGATCFDLINSYSCKCTSDYTAPLCNLAAAVNPYKLTLTPGPSRISLQWPPSPQNVRVQRLKVIIDQPITLLGPFAFQWSLNGVPLPKTTTSEQVIQANSPSVSGVYRCNMTGRTLSFGRWSGIFETGFYVYRTNEELKCAKYLSSAFSSPLLKPDTTKCTGPHTGNVTVLQGTTFTVDCTMHVKNYNGVIRIIDPQQKTYNTSRLTLRSVPTDVNGVWTCLASGGDFPSVVGKLNLTVDDIDECQGNPCKFGGTCVNIYGSYACRCDDGFTGYTCNVETLATCSAGIRLGFPNDRTWYSFSNTAKDAQSMCAASGGYIPRDELFACAVMVAKTKFAASLPPLMGILVNLTSRADPTQRLRIVDSNGDTRAVSSFSSQNKPTIRVVCAYESKGCAAYSPCKYGGTCVERGNSFICECPKGRTGPTCNFEIFSKCDTPDRKSNLFFLSADKINASVTESDTGATMCAKAGGSIPDDHSLSCAAQVASQYVQATVPPAAGILVMLNNELHGHHQRLLYWDGNSLSINTFYTLYLRKPTLRVLCEIMAT